MAWMQYFWKWVSTAAVVPVRITEIVFLFLTISSRAINELRPKWKPRMTKLVWEISFALFLVVFAISMCISSYNLYKHQETTIADLGQQLDVARKQSYPPITTLMMTQYFRDLDIPLGQFGLVSGRLANKTFENCRIIGPCVVRLGDYNSVIGASFLGDREGSFIVTSNKMTLGIIAIDHDTFLDCTFVNVSFIGSQSEIDKVKAGFAFRRIN